MTEKDNIEAYQIRVNRLSSESEKFIPYSKYIKNDYPQLNKVVPKQSILYKTKFRPEIVINEFHQTSNNFNTNINIKTNPSESLSDNIFSSDLKSNEDFKTYRNTDYINSNYYTEKPFTSIDVFHKMNLSENYIYKKKSEKNSETFSSNLSGNNNNHLELEYKINESYLNKDSKKIINYIVQNQLDSKNNINTDINNNNNNNNSKKYIKMKDNSFLYNKFSNKTVSIKKNNKNEVLNGGGLNSLKYNKHIKHKNLSMGLIGEYYKKVNTEGSETNVESKINKNNNIIFFSGQKMRKFLTSQFKNQNKDPATLKMEIYRLKLFKEFNKHFQKYYKSFIKQYIRDFLKILKENKITHINNKTVNNYYRHKQNNSYILLNENAHSNNNTKRNNNEDNLIDYLKSSTTKNYYKVYNKKNKYSSNNISLKNVYKHFKTINSDRNNNSLSNILLKNEDYLNATPRNSTNLNYLKKKKKGDVSHSPSLHIGNRTILNKDISFGNENTKGNELFRDSKELNKKFEQIQKRRRKKYQTETFNKNIGITSNKSVENHKNKKNDESNELIEIKKYIQEIKKNMDSNRNTISNERNKKYNLIKISKKGHNLNNKIGENKNKKIIIKPKNNSINNNKNIKKYKIMKVNINKNLLSKSIKDKNNNYKVIYYKDNKIYFPNSHKNIIYYSKKENKSIEEPMIIKNIITKDYLIKIHISYYFMDKKTKPSSMRYIFLKQEKTFSVALNGMEKNELKLNFKLSAIQEEDVSIQNSKLFDETDTLLLHDNKKIVQFYENINNIIIKKYKKNFIYKFKTIQLVNKINNIFNNKKDDGVFEDCDEYISNKDNNNNVKNINKKVYSKKRGIKTNKMDEKLNINNIDKNNKNKWYKLFENKIDKLRNRLINYAIYFCHKK